MHLDFGKKEGKAHYYEKMHFYFTSEFSALIFYDDFNDNKQTWRVQQCTTYLTVLKCAPKIHRRCGHTYIKCFIILGEILGKVQILWISWFENWPNSIVGHSDFREFGSILNRFQVKIEIVFKFVLSDVSNSVLFSLVGWLRNKVGIDRCR